MNGLECAGKKFALPLYMSPKEVERRAVYECQLTSQLSHPNVIEFVGLWFQDNASLPVLIVKKYEQRLDLLLRSNYIPPLSQQLSIIEGIAQGLEYLHSQNPPIIHRDLRAGNIFLTSLFVPKIGSLGNACAINIQAELEIYLLRHPNAFYIWIRAPEVDARNPICSVKVDMFCFGHLALSISVGELVREVTKCCAYY